MSNPDRKETAKGIEKAVMPRVSTGESFSENILPARPFQSGKTELSPEPAKNTDQQLSKMIQELEHKIAEQISKSRSQDVQIQFARSDHEIKSIMTELAKSFDVDKELITLAETILKIAANTCIAAEAAGTGDVSHQALAQALAHQINQLKTFDCSTHELAMLDSLEFHLMRILATINPVQRMAAQQQIIEDNEMDDDAGAGLEKSEEEDKDSDAGEIFESETDDELSPSTRKKKGKARARAKSRKSRYRKWLARMLRAFRKQNSLQRNRNKVVSSAQIRKKSGMDSPFTKTVRIFGRVTHADTGVGIGGIKIISSAFGDAVTSPDGSYAFENVTYGIHYSLAPLKANSSFSPISINDIALDSREHNFTLVF